MRKHVIDYDYYANQYALNIISGVRGYTLIKALEIFKDKFYLVKERYIKYTSAINAVRQCVRFKAVTTDPRVYQSLRRMEEDVKDIVERGGRLIESVERFEEEFNIHPKLDVIITERYKYRYRLNNVKRDLVSYNNTISAIEDIILNNKITLTSYYLELESLMLSNIKQLFKDMYALNDTDLQLATAYVSIKGE